MMLQAREGSWEYVWTKLVHDQVRHKASCASLLAVTITVLAMLRWLLLTCVTDGFGPNPLPTLCLSRVVHHAPARDGAWHVRGSSEYCSRSHHCLNRRRQVNFKPSYFARYRSPNSYDISSPQDYLITGIRLPNSANTVSLWRLCDDAASMRCMTMLTGKYSLGYATGFAALVMGVG